MKRFLFIFILILMIFSASGCVNERNPEAVNESLPNQISDVDKLQPEQDATELSIIEGIDYLIVDEPIQDFTAWDFEGNEVQLSDFEGQIVFLYFWATWCGPCREKMPYIQQFYENNKDDGVVVLAVSSTVVELRGGNDIESAQKRVRQFIEENGFTFPVVFDKYNEGWDIYQQRGIPANYVIDEEGIVRFFRPGSYEDAEQMEEFLKLVRQ